MAMLTLRIFSYLYWALVFSLALAANLKESLTGAGINVILPGDPSYASATTPCKYCTVSFVFNAHDIRNTVNLRFNFKPAAITYPRDPTEVSQILKLCHALNLKAVARGGGVSYLNILVISLIYLFETA